MFVPIAITFPDNKILHFEVLDSTQVNEELRNGMWKPEKELSQQWELELYSDRDEHILQIYPGLRMGFLLDNQHDLKILNGRVVP